MPQALRRGGGRLALRDGSAALLRVGRADCRPVLATTPVATLMFRFNNPDALLVLLLVVAAYALTRAIESTSTRG